MARLNFDVLLKVKNFIPVELKQEALNGWSILWEVQSEKTRRQTCLLERLLCGKVAYL